MLRFFYDTNSETCKSAAEIIESLGYDVRGKAITANQTLWFPQDIEPYDVAIISPEKAVKSEQWTGRHVMRSRRKLQDTHVPQWSVNFTHHLVIRRSNLDGFEYALLEAILEIHVKTETEPKDELKRRVASLRARPLPQSQPYS